MLPIREKRVGFSELAAAIDQAAPRPNSGRGGRPSFPAETMVRMLLLQQLYNLRDGQMIDASIVPSSKQRNCKAEQFLVKVQAKLIEWPPAKCRIGPGHAIIEYQCSCLKSVPMVQPENRRGQALFCLLVGKMRSRHPKKAARA